MEAPASRRVRRTDLTTRLCSRCAREKTIRGVWYLAPSHVGASPFICEACFHREARPVEVAS